MRIKYNYIMESKQQLIESIKEWVKLDTEIKTLQKEQQDRKKRKTTVSAKLIEIMQSNEIDCFNINDGQICYNRRSIKKPITKKGLFDILTKYYGGDLKQVNELNNFIVENREQVIKENIIHKISKVSDNLNS